MEAANEGKRAEGPSLGGLGIGLQKTGTVTVTVTKTLLRASDLRTKGKNPICGAYQK